MVSPWVKQTLREFGLSIGLSRLHLNDQNVACVHIDNIGSLFVESREEAVVVYLARRDDWTTDKLERALALTHPGEGHPINIFCGMREDMLVFGTRLPEGQFTLATLEQIIDTLSALHDRTLQTFV